MSQVSVRHRKALKRRRSEHRLTQNALYRLVTAAYLSATAAVGTAVLSVPVRPVTPTIGGVPASIVWQFLRDDAARSAYFSGDSQRLHDRLDDMGVEAAIKDFYRPRISNEAELDQHIHQILYDRTGYVGAAYRATAEGALVLKRER